MPLDGCRRAGLASDRGRWGLEEVRRSGRRRKTRSWDVVVCGKVEAFFVTGWNGKRGLPRTRRGRTVEEALVVDEWSLG